MRSTWAVFQRSLGYELGVDHSNHAAFLAGVEDGWAGCTAAPDVATTSEVW